MTSCCSDGFTLTITGKNNNSSTCYRIRSSYDLRHSISFLLLMAFLFLSPLTARADGIVSELTLSLSTDKACFSPGSTVTFTSEGTVPEGKTLFVRYRHGNDIIQKEAFTFTQGNTWTWKTPTNDFVGYLGIVV